MRPSGLFRPGWPKPGGGDFRFSHYVNDIPELYNLKEDPQEMQNLARMPEHRGKVEEMKTRLFEWYKPEA